MSTVINSIKTIVPESLKNLIKYLLCTNRICLNKYYRDTFAKKRTEGLDSIPIFVISYNRLSYLKQFIERMEQLGKTNIIIVDNASTYPPLLEYYKELKYKIIYMDRNYAHTVIQESKIFDEYRKDFYIVSDPDVIPVNECPEDFVERFFYLLEKYPHLGKVGFSLKLNDIPEEAILCTDVKKWEAQYNKICCKNENSYVAPIDTTFALYPPEKMVGKRFYRYGGMRTGFPY